MRLIWGLPFLIFSFNLFAHGGDSGPSTLEQEFSKLAHLHLPINYGTNDGYYSGYEIGNLEKGLAVESHPIAFGGIDKIVRATCLEQSTTGLIEICPPEAPYYLLENKKWDLGLGLEAHMHIPFPGVGVGIGFGYLKGTNYYSYRYLKNKNEKRATLNFPLSTEEFKNWRVGDQLFYMTRGTVYFNMYIGYEPFVHLGPQISRTGVHRITMTKVDEKTLIAEIGTIKAKDFSVEVYGLVLGGEFNKGRGKASSHIYQFNMDDVESYSHLANFMSGRLALVNPSVREGAVKVIRKVASLI